MLDTHKSLMRSDCVSSPTAQYVVTVTKKELCQSVEDSIPAPGTTDASSNPINQVTEIDLSHVNISWIVPKGANPPHGIVLRINSYQSLGQVNHQSDQTMNGMNIIVPKSSTYSH